MRDTQAGAELARSFDLSALPPAFYDDPFPTYHALRAYDPVLRLADGSYFLTRYADLNAVYRDTKTFTSDKQVEFAPKYGPESLLYQHHTTSLVFNDPPLHTRVRHIIIGALSPNAVSALEPGLVAMVGGLLDALAAKNDVDLIDDFASTIPIEVIGNLLGVPHAERAPLRTWSLAILGALEPAPSVEVHSAGNRAVDEFLAYLRILVAERREHPGDPESDVLTRLILGEDNGERLTETELLHNCIFLLNAGHETTTNLIGNGLAALLDWPEQKQALIAEPALIESAIEEFLRFESSNQLGNRMTATAAVVGGVPLPGGTPLTLCIGAANRDPVQFPDPDVLDIRRSPNRHLAFASGPHQCAGLHIARLEGRIGIAAFLRRFPRYRLRGTPVRGGRARFRGFMHIPVTLT
jgi:cytochrome P450